MERFGRFKAKFRQIEAAAKEKVKSLRDDIKNSPRFQSFPLLHGSDEEDDDDQPASLQRHSRPPDVLRDLFTMDASNSESEADDDDEEQEVADPESILKKHDERLNNNSNCRQIEMSDVEIKGTNNLARSIITSTVPSNYTPCVQSNMEKDNSSKAADPFRNVDEKDYDSDRFNELCDQYLEPFSTFLGEPNESESELFHMPKQGSGNFIQSFLFHMYFF